VATETDSGAQSTWRVFAQKLNSHGVRQWGNAGVELIANSTNQPSFVQVQAVKPPAALAGASVPRGMMMFCFDRSTNPHVLAARLEREGQFIWSPTLRQVCSVSSGKGRLWSAMDSTDERAFLAWSDARNATPRNPGEADIYALAITRDGLMGNPGDVNDDGAVNADDLLAMIATWGACAPFCPADLAPPPSGNAAVNADDLLVIIANWG
jgi:hypothetical protein